MHVTTCTAEIARGVGTVQFRHNSQSCPLVVFGVVVVVVVVVVIVVVCFAYLLQEICELQINLFLKKCSG